jgi:beta-N-acetylhexosaminidase
LRSVGIDSNCAPTLDVAGPDTHPFLQNRCYGKDPATVAALGRATADGFLDGGVLPVMKHMPGHGAATQDSHFDLPCVDVGAETLQEREFAPFAALNDVPLGMTAHLVYAALDDQPATQSETVITHIRDQIGFYGLLMTDDISMQALSGTLAERSKTSLAAGCDVILHCNDTFAERREVAGAAGEMTDAAQLRAMAALDQRKDPDQIDIPALEDELEALLAIE